MSSTVASRIAVVGAICILLGGADSAEARVFDLNKESFAAYFGGTFGTTGAGDSAFSLSSGSGTRLDKTSPTAGSGEIGVLFSGAKFNFKIGGEYLAPRALEGVNGTSSSGTSLFSLTSKTAALIPKVAIEYTAYRTPDARMLMGVGYGWAFATLDNHYTMTSAGQAAFGVGDYIESGKSSAPLIEAYLGFEYALADTTSVSFLAGYRELRVTGFKALDDTNAIVGTERSGTDLFNGDGGKRTVNFGGLYAGLHFRFYLGQ